MLAAINYTYAHALRNYMYIIAATKQDGCNHFENEMKLAFTENALVVRFKDSKAFL